MDNEKGWIALFWSMIGLGILAVIFNSGKVESDLTGRVNTALHESGYDWASIKQSSGRNLVLSGQSPIKAAQKGALDTARDVYGVRSVDDETSVRGPASPYAWSATVNQNEIILAGNVPDERTKAMIAKKAESLAAGRKITDRTTLADGAPSEGWEENIVFALNQAKQIKNGAVMLVDQTVKVEGTTWNNADSKALTETANAVAGYKLTTKVKSPAMAAEEERTGSKKIDARPEKKSDDSASATQAAGESTRALPQDNGSPDRLSSETTDSGKGSSPASADKVTDTVTANSDAAKKPDADRSGGVDESNTKTAAAKKDNQGIAGKAITALKSLGTNDEDNTKSAAGASGEKMPAANRVARSDGTENGAANPVTSKEDKESDSAAASSKPSFEADTTPGGETGKMVGTGKKSGSIDTTERTRRLKTDEAKAVSAQANGQQAAPQANSANVAARAGVRGYRRAYAPVPRAMVAPAWVGPPWIAGPYGPVYRPYPVCPWGPAFCPPVW